MALEHNPSLLAPDAPWSTESLRFFNRDSLGAYATQSFLKAICNTVPEGLIVEIGAGIGYLGSLLPEQERPRARYVQTDIGPKNCQIAAELNPDVVTVCAAAQELPFAAESVSLVVGRSVLDVVSTEEVISDVARVLKPGGQFVHLRHTQPNLEWLTRHYPVEPSQHLLPHFDESSRFERYKVVNKKQLKRYIHANHLPDLFCDPRLYTAMDEDLVARKAIQYHSGNIKETALTPVFGDMMNEITHEMFTRAGFDTAFATSTHTELVSLREARKAGLEAGVNYWYNNAGFLAAFYNPDVPKGMAHIESALALTIASKS